MKRIILPIVALFISQFSIAQICTKAQLPTSFQNDLVAFYPFCGNANDVSGNGNNGTVNGATLTTDRFGNANSAYYFSGASCNTYIQATVNTSNIQTGVTISVWVNRSGVGCINPRLFEFWPGSDGPRQAQWQWSNPNAIAMGHRTSTGVYVTTEVPAPSENIWTHLVYTNDGSSAKFYRDGQLIATLTSSGNPTLASNLAIGRMNHSSWDAFNGKIDDFIVLSRALSECEVQQLFSETSGGTFTSGGFSYNVLPTQKSFCGPSTTLDAGSGYTSYLWSTGATSQTITATSSGEYSVTVTNSSGCVASDTTSLNIIKSDILQNNSTICKGTSITLSVDSSFTAQNLNNINLLPSNLKTGLKAYYPFSGNANDVSGNNNNGTVTGATLTTDRFGNANSAYAFNGSSFIDLGNIAGVGYSTTQDISMSFWINEGASGTVISKYTNLDAPNSNFFMSKAGSSAQLAGNGTNSFTASNITDYRWTNYVFIASSGTNKSFLYRNGVLVATGTLNANSILSATKIMLGKLMGSPSNFFTGKIDDVFIYNRVLSVSEIAQLSNFQPKVTWSTGATTNTISVTPTVTTKYYATVSDGITSCMDSVTVTVSDIGIFNPFPTQSSSCSTSKLLDAGTGYSSYLWNTGATSQTISPTINGEYIVTVTNAAGCSASDTVSVSLIKADIIQTNQTVCAGTTINLFIDSTFSGSVINAKSQMSANLQTGLVAYYPFNGNATDISGNNNVLTANGVTLTTDRFGRPNSAYSFTNTQTSVTNYLKAVNPAPFAKNTYTISAWFNSRQFYPNIGGVTYNYQSIVFYSPQWYIYGPAYHLALQHANNSVLEGGNWTTTNTNQGVTSANGSIVVNQWYHVVLSYDGTTIKMYKDGQLVGSRAATISYANQIQFLIGGAGDGPSPGGIYGGFNGKIDDVGFWDRALTFNEIQELYNGRPSVLWSTSETTNKISVTPSITTKYYATLTDGIASCTDSVSIVVDNLSGFNPLQDTVKVCGDSLVLDAGAGFASYNWSNGATTRTITAKASGKYFVTVSTLAGCSANDTSYVSIVKAKILQRDTTICNLSQIQLTAFDPVAPNMPMPQACQGWGGYPISSPKMNSQGFIDVNSGELFQLLMPRNFTPMLLCSSSYFVNPSSAIISNYNCNNNVSIAQDVRFNTPGIYYIQGRVSDGISSTTCTVGVRVRAYLYNWSTGDSSNSIIVSPNQTTTYYVSVTDGITTCRDSITVTVSKIGTFNPLQDTVKVCGDSTVLDAGTGFASYNWSNGATTRTITVKSSGKYFVTVANANGCIASDTSIVSIVKAKILQRDTTICKGSSITLAIDSSFSASITNCNISNLPANIKTGLVAYFPFCGNASDATTNSNNATVYGPVLTTDRFGFANSAYSFNQSGSNQYMSIGSSSSLNITGSLTLSFWFSPSTANAGYIIDRDICNPNPDWSIRWEGGKIIARYGIVGQDFEISSNVIPLNTWNIVTVVRNSSNSKLYLYINGILSSSINYSGANFTNNLNNIYIGESLCNSSTNPNFSGKLDDIYIFNRALNSNEILQLNTTVSSVSWSNGATSNSINVAPTSSAKYFVTVSDGITTCNDSVTVTVSDIGTFNPLQDTVKVCGDSTVLDAGAGFASYHWSNGATTRMITAKASSKYFVNVANASGCRASDTSVVSVINANIIQSDTTVCKGNNLTLQISLKPNQNASWSNGATTPSIVVNPTIKTKYFVTVSDGITTCTDSVIVDVSSSELKVTDPAAVCSPGVVNLTAAAITAGSASGLTYTYWKDANATQALANPDKVSVSGTYYIVGTSSTGCTSAPTAVKVTINPLPVATIVTPTQTTICDKSTLTLTATGGTSYQWFYNGAAIPGATNSSYAASLAGSYEVNVMALGCTSKVAAPVNLSLITAAVPKFSNSSTCIDVPVSFFNETDTSTSGSVSWLWDFGDGQTSTIFNPVYTYKKSGAFIVKLAVTPKLCSSLSSIITKNITVDIPPVGIRYPNVLAVKNKATPLSARFIANGYSYLWMPSTGLNNGAIQKPVFNFSQEQLYRIRLTSAGGCITMDTVKVSVYDSSDIFVPKAFTPNNDGKNDLLQPFLVNITKLNFFRVYNRWGQLMFQSSDSKQGWDGMYNYKPQPLETYTWIAEGIDGNGTTIFRKGQTVLIR